MRSRRLCLTHSLSHFLCLCVFVGVCLWRSRREDETMRKRRFRCWRNSSQDILKDLDTQTPVLCDVFTEKRERKPKTEKKKTKPQTDLSSIPPSTISNPPHPPTKSNRNSEVYIEIQNRNDAPSALRRKKNRKNLHKQRKSQRQKHNYNNNSYYKKQNNNKEVDLLLQSCGISSSACCCSELAYPLWVQSRRAFAIIAFAKKLRQTATLSTTKR